MKIRSMMVSDPITISEHSSIQDALEIMKVNSIRHLPVISEDKSLRGFVTMADLRVALIPSMVAGVSLSDVMVRDPITVKPGDDIEVAAQLIYKHKIGGIPVVSKGKLAGIITESDLLRAFIDMMGILTASSRIDVVIEREEGRFRRALQIINDQGGDIVNVGATARKTKKKRTYHFRLTPCKTAPIKTSLEEAGYRVIAAMD